MSDATVPCRYVTNELLSRLDPSCRLEEFFALLTKENERVNLVSRETIGSGLPQLAAESLVPLESVDRDSFERYLDIGSGGGFPSIPILLTSEITQTTLVERTQKKATALKRMSDAMNLNVHIAPVTLEDLPQSDVRYDLITMRLVRLTPRLLRRIIPRLSPGGVFIYYAQSDLVVPDDSVTSRVESFQDEQERIKNVTLYCRKV
ncbi:MAG: class I SAM-dependent methyltransferase [candidate division Zixibacteria bacterium]|nr:class I SAM-dependent methyltransferase [candidate division Zixibacteria bacterium]